MKRTVAQWKGCDPVVMAKEQSQAAIAYAFEDAKSDIIELATENASLKNTNLELLGALQELCDTLGYCGLTVKAMNIIAKLEE